MAIYRYMDKNTNKMKRQADGCNPMHLYHRSYCSLSDTVRLFANTTSDPRGIFYSVPAIASKGPAGLDDQPFSTSPVSAAGDTYRPVAQLVEPPIVCSGECVGSSPAWPIETTKRTPTDDKYLAASATFSAVVRS